MLRADLTGRAVASARAMISEANGGQDLGRRKSSLFAAAKPWWLFCATILIAKLLLLAFDASPRLYLPDSLAYLRSALSGRVPADLSYFYAYVIRWLRSEEHTSELQSLRHLVCRL